MLTAFLVWWKKSRAQLKIPSETKNQNHESASNLWFTSLSHSLSLPGSAPSCKKLICHPCHPFHNKESWTNWKSTTSLGLAENWSCRTNHHPKIWTGESWDSASLEQKPLEPQTDGGRMCTNVRVRTPWGLRSWVGVNFRYPPGSHCEEQKKESPHGSGQRKNTLGKIYSPVERLY